MLVVTSDATVVVVATFEPTVVVRNTETLAEWRANTVHQAGSWFYEHLGMINTSSPLNSTSSVTNSIVG